MRTILTLSVVGLLRRAWRRARGPRSYELRGQVLAVDRARQEITIKHDDIRGLHAGHDDAVQGDGCAAARRADRRRPGQGDARRQEPTRYLSAIDAPDTRPLTEPPPPPRMDILEPGQLVPDVQLTDETGHAARCADWRGRVAGRHVHIHALSAAGLLPADGSTVQRVQRADPGRPGRCAIASALLSVSFDPGIRHTSGARRRTRRQVGRRSARLALRDRRARTRSTRSRRGSACRSFARERPPTDVTHNLRTAVIDPTGRSSRCSTATTGRRRADRRVETRALSRAPHGSDRRRRAAVVGVHAATSGASSDACGRRVEVQRFLNALPYNTEPPPGGATLRTLSRRRPASLRRTASKRRSPRR